MTDNRTLSFKGTLTQIYEVFARPWVIFCHTQNLGDDLEIHVLSLMNIIAYKKPPESGKGATTPIWTDNKVLYKSE